MRPRWYKSSRGFHRELQEGWQSGRMGAPSLEEAHNVRKKLRRTCKDRRRWAARESRPHRVDQKSVCKGGVLLF
jgi:hypothetical protein